MYLTGLYSTSKYLEVYYVTPWSMWIVEQRMKYQSTFVYVHLWSLSELQLQENNLSGLPEEIRDLEELKTLDISNNKFESLPSLYDCPKLSTVSAKDNKITGLGLIFKLLITYVCIQKKDNFIQFKEVMLSIVNKSYFCWNIPNLNNNKNDIIPWCYMYVSVLTNVLYLVFVCK